MTTRTLTVGRTENGRSLADWLRASLKMSRPAVLQLLQQRRVRVAGSPCSNPDWRLRAGQRIEVRLPGQPSGGTRPQRQRQQSEAKGPAPVIRYQDDDIVVADGGVRARRHRSDGGHPM